MGNIYQENPYLMKSSGIVDAAFEEDGKFYVAVSGSLFYPQGGGQKGDRGILRVNGQEFRVADTVKDLMSSDLRPLCVLAEPAPSLSSGMNVDMEIDEKHRLEQMRLHGIVHLHHCAMELVAGEDLPVPITSDLELNATAYNRYDTEKVTEDLALHGFEKMKSLVATGGIVQTRDDPNKQGFRYWEALGFSIPCGGTHLRDVSEIGQFSIDYSKKKGKPKVTFELK